MTIAVSSMEIWACLQLLLKMIALHLELVRFAPVMLLLLLQVLGIMVHHPVAFMPQSCDVAMQSLPMPCHVSIQRKTRKKFVRHRLV